MDGAKTSTYKDYYYILGLNPSANSDQIHRAYVDLYERFGPHVSVNGQDPEAMLKAYKDICEAYEVLMDPRRRQEYDNSSSHLEKNDVRNLWEKISRSSTTSSVDPLPATAMPKAGLSATTISQGMSVPGRAEDTLIDIEVTLREAIKGTVRKVRIEENLPCRRCVELKPVQRLKCEDCRGVGHVRSARDEQIELAPGMYDRMQLRKPGLGKADARSGNRGDLVLVIKIRPSSHFEVQGRDVLCTVPVSFLEAILGGEIEVPTPTGKVIMKIQPLTHSGRVYRLKAMGLAGADLLATVDIVVPTQISAEEVELFRKLQNVSTMKNPRTDLLAKIKEELSEKS